MQRFQKIRFLLLAFSGVIGLFLIGTVILISVGLRDQLSRADIGLVFGSKVELDGSPSLRLRARLDRTIELYKKGYFPTVIVSGGIGKEGYDEASVMQDYLVSHGIPKERVIMDNAGATTFATAKNTVKIIHQNHLGSVLVISQYFHIPRAKLALKRFGISEVYSSHAHYFELRDLYSSPRELFGYLCYECRHYE